MALTIIYSNLLAPQPASPNSRLMLCVAQPIALMPSLWCFRELMSVFGLPDRNMRTRCTLKLQRPDDLRNRAAGIAALKLLYPERPPCPPRRASVER